MLHLKTRTGAFAALEHGQEGAPVVLCVHGFPDHPPSMRPLAERLALAGFRTVSPWLRGYAPSVLAGPFHVDQIADDLVAIADAVSPDAPVFLIGHDWGAVATYAALTRAPYRFRAAVTLAVPHPLAFLRNLRRPRQLRMSGYMFAMQFPGWSERWVSRDDFAVVDALWQRWSPGYRLPPSDRAELIGCLERSMPAPIQYYQALVRPPAEVARRLRRASAEGPITVPTLYLHGADDGCIAGSSADGQARFFAARHQMETLPCAGHFLQLEAPDAVADRAIRWFRSA